jgi:hypothetical protein
MARILSSEVGRAVNRKQVQRLFHILNWIEPFREKADIIRSKAKMMSAFMIIRVSSRTGDGY